MGIKILIAVGLLSLILSCNKPINLEKQRAAILEIHNSQQKAHLTKNVELLVQYNADDYTEINKGRIRQPTLEESKVRFQSYFDAVDFIKWDDVSPPKINFSLDGTLATTVVDKIAITKDKIGSEKIDTAYFAWLAVYKKTNDHWKLHQLCSTNR